MRTSRSRTYSFVAWLGVPVAIVASGVLVSASSYSAFTSVTSNGENNWTTGSVALTDDAAGAALFNATGMTPGATGTKCIVVTSTSTVEADVRLYLSDVDDAANLGEHVTVTVRTGTGGGNGSCDGFVAAPGSHSATLAQLATDHNTYATGLGGWTVDGTAPESKTYEITYTLSPDAPNELMDASATATVTWEAQSR